MEIELTTAGAITVATITGRIDAYTAPEVEERLIERAGAGDHLVIDLAHCDYISSAGLRVLITLAKKALQGGFQMRLCGLQEPVLEVFEIAGFTKLFELRESCQAALDELSAA